MTYWKPLVIDGEDIDLAHLEPFAFEITPKDWAKCAIVRVRFNNHCFSEVFDPTRHRDSLPISHVSAHEQRAFDPLRYALSKGLAAHVRAFDGQRVSQTRQDSLVRLTLEDGQDYAIFFTLKKADAALCDLFVITAYPLERSKAQIVATGEMRFNLAVAKVLEGKRLKFPPRN